MFPIIEDPERKNKMKDYVDYLDRNRRTTGKTRFETHQIKLSQETAKYYGLTDKEINEIGEILKNEQSEENKSQFSWSNEEEDPEIFKNGITIVWAIGDKNSIQKFVEALSYKIGHKCDFSFTAGRAHIDVLEKGYEKAKEALNDSDFINEFVVPYSSNNTKYFEFLS